METVAALTNLEEKGSPQDCPILALDGCTMQLRSSRPLNIGSPVKVEADDTISLGEVSFCRPEGGGYVVWIDLMQQLHDVAELSRLARALLA